MEFEYTGNSCYFCGCSDNIYQLNLEDNKEYKVIDVIRELLLDTDNRIRNISIYDKEPLFTEPIAECKSYCNTGIITFTEKILNTPINSARKFGNYGFMDCEIIIK